jgi:hypothetical protein
MLHVLLFASKMQPLTMRKNQKTFRVSENGIQTEGSKIIKLYNEGLHTLYALPHTASVRVSE